MNRRLGDESKSGYEFIARLTLPDVMMRFVAEDPLRAVLADPARQPIAGAMPVLTVRDDDDPAYRDALRRVERFRSPLRRRGQDHGTVVEILRPDLAPKPSLGTMRRCWKAARPFVLRGAAPLEADVSAKLPEAWAGPAEAVHAAAWLCSNDASARIVDPATHADPERDVAKVRNEAAQAWAKLSRLSTAAGDHSRRLCFGVGEEIHDDDHPDPARHAAVFEWAAQLCPELGIIASSGVFEAAGRARRAALVPSNPIVYWNRPDGGALFHHDALPGYLRADLRADLPTATTPRARASGQRGVVFVQGVGMTFWVAVSIADLAARSVEFIEEIIEGAAPWMFEAFVKAAVWDAMFQATRHPDKVIGELAQPDAGAMQPLVHGSLEFTGFLIDSGHGCVLHPGDAVALPNHGPHRTAMHSVYCGSAGPNVGYSIGLRDG